ncbi:MAG: hypothetical protein WC863_02625 [Patescibacteria group bacterium]
MMNPDKMGNQNYRFGIISDTQGRKGQQLDEALEPLKNHGENLDFIVHIGDLAGSGILSEYVKEAKGLALRYDKEKKTDKLSLEVEEYIKIIESPEYHIFKEQQKNIGMEQDIAVYALWMAKSRGELDQAMADMRQSIKDVTSRLSELKSDVRHIMGNADRPFPQKLEATQELLKEAGVDSYDKPLNLPLDDKTSVIFWPSFKVDEKNAEQTNSLEKTIDDFAQLNKDKKSILIFAHETPFKGPKKPGVYEKQVKQANLPDSERVPYKQFLPVSKYLMELCRRLPAKADIYVACGHMHVSRETLAAGINFLDFDESGKAKLRLFGGQTIDHDKYETIPGEKRTINLYYLPEGEVGIFEIKDDGEIIYKNLSK